MKNLFSILLVIFAMLIAGCAQTQVAQQDDVQVQSDEMPDMEHMDDTVSETVVESSTTSAEPSSITEDGVKVFNVDAFSFGYSMKEIRVNKGDKVKIIVTNTGGTHDFFIDELNVRTPIIKTGDTAELEFTVPNEAVQYEYYCSVGSHRAAGMFGTLIVE